MKGIRESFASAISRGIQKGLKQCQVYDDDIDFMTAEIIKAVLEEIKRDWWEGEKSEAGTTKTLG